MMRRVLQHHPEIFEVEAVAQRALDADIGGDADEDDVADAARRSVLSSCELKKAE
jgi:hypothetical protein